MNKKLYEDGDEELDVSDEPVELEVMSKEQVLANFKDKDIDDIYDELGEALFSTYSYILDTWDLEELCYKFNTVGEHTEEYFSRRFLKEFDDETVDTNGVYNHHLSSDDIEEGDISKRFLKACFDGDVMDYFIDSGEYIGSSDIDNSINYLDENNLIKLEELGFTGDILKKCLSPDYDDGDIEYAGSLRAAIQKALGDGVMSGSADAAIELFEQKFMEAIPDGCTFDAETSSRGGDDRIIKITREYVAANIESIGYDYSDGGRTVCHSVGASFEENFNYNFNFYEPRYGFYGFDKVYFNTSLSEQYLPELEDEIKAGKNKSEDLVANRDAKFREDINKEGILEDKNKMVDSKILLESTDYAAQAVKILDDAGLFSHEQNKFYINDMHTHYIHAFNGAKPWLMKYLKGIARMMVEEAGNGTDKNEKAEAFRTSCGVVFDRLFSWIKENRTEENAKDLDKKVIVSWSYQDCKDFLAELANEDARLDAEKISKIDTSKQSQWKLVPINSYEEFHNQFGGTVTGNGQPGNSSPWCHANTGENFYNSWVYETTAEGKYKKYKFYVLAHNNYKNIPAVKGEGSPKDEYGLSLMALKVQIEPIALMNCTLRWNHVNVESNADNQFTNFGDLSLAVNLNVKAEIEKDPKRAEDKAGALINVADDDDEEQIEIEEPPQEPRHPADYTMITIHMQDMQEINAPNVNAAAAMFRNSTVVGTHISGRNMGIYIIRTGDAAQATEKFIIFVYSPTDRMGSPLYLPAGGGNIGLMLFNTQEAAQAWARDNRPERGIRDNNNREITFEEGLHESLTGDKCPYCGSTNIDAIDDDGESSKMICRDCEDDFIVWYDKDGKVTDVTDRHNSTLHEDTDETRFFIYDPDFGGDMVDDEPEPVVIESANSLYFRFHR